MDHLEEVRASWIEHPFWARFVPEYLQGTGGIDEVRARILIVSTLATWIWCPTFALLHWFEGRAELAAVAAIATVAIACVPLVFQWTGSFKVAANLLAGTVWATLVVHIPHTGGVQNPAMFWLVLVPVIPHIFELRKSSRAWLAIAILTLVAFWLGYNRGYDFVFLSVGDSSLDNVWILSVVSALLAVTQFFSLNSGLERWLSQKVRQRESEKRRVEKELQQAQQRAFDRSLESLQMVVHRVPDGVVIFRQGRIIQTNPAFRRMLGCEEEVGLVGVEVAELVDEAERDELTEFIGKVETGEEISYREFRLCEARETAKEGVVVEASGFQGVHGQERVGFLVLRDLTERKELQSKLMQMDRMMAVGTLAAGVAHEINNPLAFVHANIEFLLTHTKKYTADDDESLRALTSSEDIIEVLEDIREGSVRIRNIVSDLSTFSGSEEVQMQPLDLEDILDSCIKMGENQIRHRAQLVLDYQEVPAVRGIESNLAQVFLNLVVNAAQAIEEGAVEDNEVCISTRLREAGDTVVVEVSDTGSGIPEQIQARVFDPFFSTKDQHEGMGLGLSICRNLIRNHDGDISFHTEQGEGTTFYVELPAAAEQAEQSHEFKIPVFAREHKGRALVIDDEPQVGRTVERILNDGYDTVTVTSGRQALERLEEDREFAIIICDLLMPDVSGVDVYDEITRRHADLVDRMVFMTGGTFTETTREFAESCDQPILLKPFDITDFREVVDKTATVAQLAAYQA